MCSFWEVSLKKGAVTFTLPSSYSWKMDVMERALAASFVHEVTLGMEAARSMRQEETGSLPPLSYQPGTDYF